MEPRPRTISATQPMGADLDIDVSDASGDVAGALDGPRLRFPDPVGKVLSGRYRILERLGAGGMATVYLAEHTSIGRKLAVKILNPEYAVQPDVVKRFLQEARAASLIRHPHIVDITDFGFTPEGLAFFAMELLEGDDLCTLLEREGPLPWERVGPMILQVCDALDAAHRKGIIHRDIKPENIVRTEVGGTLDFIKVLDFGLAKDLSGQFQGQIAGRTRTVSGAMFGTPGYISPDLLNGKPPDARVDIYSLGVVIYELLAGERPFVSDTPSAVLLGHLQQQPRPLRERFPDKVTPAVDALVLRALEKDPARRFQTMQELANAILDTFDPESLPASIGAVAVTTGSYATTARHRVSLRTAQALVPVDAAAPRRRALAIVAALAAVVAVAAAIVLLTPWTGAEEHAPEDMVAAPMLPPDDPPVTVPVPPAVPIEQPQVQPQVPVAAPPTGSDVDVGPPVEPAVSTARPPRPKSPKPLTAEAARTTIRRQVEGKARQCLEKHTTLFKGQRFRVRVDIAANGVASATAAQMPNSEAARCIAALFRRAKFPASTSGVSLEVEFHR
jgi:hypothetical protein